MGARQSMPSSNIESCARLKRDLAAGCLWPDKAASLQSFGQKAEPVAVEPEELHYIAAPPAKDEHMARERLLFEHRLHLHTQPLKAAPHVGHARRKPESACLPEDQSRSQALQHSTHRRRSNTAFQADQSPAWKLDMNRSSAWRDSFGLHFLRKLPMVSHRDWQQLHPTL